MTTPQTTAYFSVDNVGSPTALSDGSGGSLGSFDRQPFGDGATSSGVDPSVAGVPIGFTGELQDPVTGLVDLRARNYDPATGRFLSTDPLGPQGGNASYVYGGANPLRYVDPAGLKFGEPCTSWYCSGFLGYLTSAGCYTTALAMTAADAYLARRAWNETRPTGPPRGLIDAAEQGDRPGTVGKVVLAPVAATAGVWSSCVWQSTQIAGG